MQASANDRVNAIGADEHRAAVRASVLEMERDASAVFGERHRLAAKPQGVAIDGAHERAVQLGTEGDDCRNTEALRVEPPEDPAAGVPKLESGKPGTGTNDRLGDAELLKRPQRVGRQSQAEAELARAVCLFVNADDPPRAAEHQPRREAADAGADDERGAHRGLTID